MTETGSVRVGHTSEWKQRGNETELCSQSELLCYAGSVVSCSGKSPKQTQKKALFFSTQASGWWSPSRACWLESSNQGGMQGGPQSCLSILKANVDGWVGDWESKLSNGHNQASKLSVLALPDDYFIFILPISSSQCLLLQWYTQLMDFVQFHRKEMWDLGFPSLLVHSISAILSSLSKLWNHELLCICQLSFG